MRKVYEALQNGAVYAKTIGLPFGMNSSGYIISFLGKSLDDLSPKISTTS